MPSQSNTASRPPRFETKRIEQTRPGKLRFVQLAKKGTCQFEAFLGQLAQEGGYEKEVDKAINLMDQLARLKRLRGEQHRALGTLNYSIENKVHSVTLYEIKTKSLRIYYFHQPPDTEVVVLMGKKNTQDSDISSFEGLVGQYLTFLHA